MIQLDSDQQPFVDAMLATAKGLHYLTGGPGSGKAFTIQYLMQSFSNASTPALPTVTTGAAPYRISFGARTLHDTFGLPAVCQYIIALPIESSVYEDMRRARVILVDEVSMLKPETLELAMHRLMEAHGCTHDLEALLDSVLNLPVGDHAQLSHLQAPAQGLQRQ